MPCTFFYTWVHEKLASILYKFRDIYSDCKNQLSKEKIFNEKQRRWIVYSMLRRYEFDEPWVTIKNNKKYQLTSSRSSSSCFRSVQLFLPGEHQPQSTIQFSIISHSSRWVPLQLLATQGKSVAYINGMSFKLSTTRTTLSSRWKYSNNFVQFEILQ